MALVLDAGALIAFDDGDRFVAALVAATRRREEAVVTSSGAAAQAWRLGGPRQARLLQGTDERALDDSMSRAVGFLCTRAGVADVVDAHVVLCTVDGDTVVTSDADDLRALVRAARRRVELIRC